MLKRYRDLSLAKFKHLAEQLARQYRGTKKIIGLIGPLGSGKTTLVKQLSKSLGLRHAKSPTFTIIHHYPHRQYPMIHLDLYRLQPKDLPHLGLRELFQQPPGLIVIEWLDRDPNLKSLADIIIELEAAPDPAKRHVTIRTK